LSYTCENLSTKASKYPSGCKYSCAWQNFGVCKPIFAGAVQLQNFVKGLEELPVLQYPVPAKSDTAGSSRDTCGDKSSDASQSHIKAIAQTESLQDRDAK
jgi:hypothetical protein